MSGKSKDIKFLNTWQGEVALLLAYVLVAYGFASWAIDSAHMYAYAGGVLFIVLAIRKLWELVRQLFKR